MSDGVERRGPRRRPRPVQRKKPAPVKDSDRVIHGTPQARILQLQQDYGNRAVTQLLTAQREPRTFASTLSSGAYVDRFADQLARDLMAELTEFHPPTGSPFAIWKPMGSGLFVYRAIAPWRAAGTSSTTSCVETLGFSAVKRAVNRGRDKTTTTRTHGPPAYSGAVALELRRLVSARITESMAYLGPRYVAARNQARCDTKPTDRRRSTEPAAADLVRSHPIDVFLIPALLYDVLRSILRRSAKDVPASSAARPAAPRDRLPLPDRPRTEVLDPSSAPPTPHRKRSRAALRRPGTIERPGRRCPAVRLPSPPLAGAAGAWESSVAMPPAVTPSSSTPTR